MTAKVSTLEGYTERSIAEIDYALGTRCGLVLETAISIDPRLKSTMVASEVRVAGDAYAQYCSDGSNIVVLSTNFDCLKEDLDGCLAWRNVRMHQLYEKLKIRVSTRHIVEFIFGHELGHIKRYLDVQQLYPEKVTEYISDSEADIRSYLPLRTTSEEARELWENNTGGYRTYMENAGYNEETFRQALLANSLAHSRIPEEELADDFSLWVLATMHKTPNSTLNRV